MRHKMEQLKLHLMKEGRLCGHFQDHKHYFQKCNQTDSAAHSTICALPETALPVHAEASFFTMILFFHQANLIIDGQVITCMPYSIVIMKEGSTYQIESAEPQHTVFVIDCSNAFFDSFLLTQIADCPIFYDMLTLDQADNEYLMFDIVQDEMILKSVELLLSEWICHQEDTHGAKNCKLLLVVLLSQLDRHHIEYLVVTDSSMLKDNERGKILKYISDNLADATLASTAQHFNFHPAYFSVLFKKLFYVSFSEKCLTLKLDHAKRLLLTTDLSTEQIKECAGFRDKSYFFKTFKAHMQMTPNQYRKKYQKLYQ